MRFGPRWLLDPVVVAVQRVLIAEHGGAEGIRDPGLLESALARPKNRFAYGEEKPSVFDLAASYGWGLARNHCFVDGNKRIALTACLMFLEMNGFRLEAPREERLRVFLGLAAGDVSENQLSEWLASRSRPLEP